MESMFWHPSFPMQVIQVTGTVGNWVEGTWSTGNRIRSFQALWLWRPRALPLHHKKWIPVGIELRGLVLFFAIISSPFLWHGLSIKITWIWGSFFFVSNHQHDAMFFLNLLFNNPVFFACLLCLAQGFVFVCFFNIIINIKSKSRHHWFTRKAN